MRIHRIYILASALALSALGSACKFVDPASKTEGRVVIMSFNVLHGGTRLGQPLTQTAKVIEKAGADIVGLQEAGDSAEKLAKLLGWNLVRQGRSPVILTRYEIMEPCDGGARLKLDSGREIYVFNLHLPPAPYQPYQLLGIPYGDAPFIETEQEAIAFAVQARGTQVEELLDRIEAVSKQGVPVFITGDFNEPSHLDWTERAALARQHPLKVAYPASMLVTKAGFTDAWRSYYPDELNKPGFTWTPTTAPEDPKDHHDRIDYVYFRGDGIELDAVKLVGESAANADIVVSPYPSDHRAVAAIFRMALP